MITAEQVNGSEWRNTAHLNMGRAGYGYEYTSEQYPRIAFIDRTYRPAPAHPDGKREREWYVDGAPVASFEAAIAALNVSPVFTEDEERILALIPAEPTDLRELEDDLAGVPHPQGAIMPDTPHSRVGGWIRSLARKGAIRYGRRELPDGRWSPTVERVL